jgi:hypothetical protein
MTTFRPHWPRLTAIPTRVGQCLAVTALMAGLAIGASAVANAEWDIGRYDTCVHALDRQFGRNEITLQQLQDGYKQCCTASGGVLTLDETCVAPPLYAEPQGPVAPAPTAASQPPAPATPVPPVAPRPTVIGPGAWG